MEKIPVMNVHKPPSIEVPVKIEDCSTSFINSVDPRSMGVSPVRYILRDEKPFSEMGGSPSGDTLSILNVYRSSNWAYYQRSRKIFCASRPTFWSPRAAFFSFVIVCVCVIARVAQM